MTQSLRFHFVLPFSGRKPVGGFKVVYEYANELARRGYYVHITHAAGLYLGVNPNDKLWVNISKFIIFGILGNYGPNRWFSLDPRVKTSWRPSLHAVFLPKADYIVATSWETAEWVARCSSAKGESVYLIQHLEDWYASKDRVLKTWKSISKKIVISQWLGRIAEELHEPYCYSPNGLDFNAFGIDLPPEKRQPASILMLHHEQPFKGTQFGIQALEEVRKKAPDTHVTLFGAQPPAPDTLPTWVNFELRPSPERLRELYNTHAIFISPSLSEGWALPPAEAMQCGCATVLTQIGGHEYAIEGVTSLLSLPERPQEMAKQILSLIQNPVLRIAMGEAGHKEIARYSWQRATDRLLDFLVKPEAPLER